MGGQPGFSEPDVPTSVLTNERRRQESSSPRGCAGGSQVQRESEREMGVKTLRRGFHDGQGLTRSGTQVGSRGWKRRDNGFSPRASGRNVALDFRVRQP